MHVVRISRGSFDKSDYARVAARLDASKESLVPAIKRLNGLVSYYAGADERA